LTGLTVGLRLPRETAKSRRCFAPRNPRPDAEYAFQDFKLIEARRPPLNDPYDEWLARIIRYAFSVPVSPFVSQVNRATGETMRQQATQEGLVPLKAWVKNALDHVIRECMNEPGLEFVWVGDDAIDPLEQAQTLQILVGAGIKTREEARADLGLAPAGGAPGKPQAGLGKHNPHHDERGQFASADNAAATVGSPARKPRPTGIRAASNDTVLSDVGALSPVAYTGREGKEPKSSTEGDPDATMANITCEDLLESDYAVCSSAAFEDDHHYRGLCVRNMLLRNRQCLDGLSISPLLPY
jgi:hypothetical protein